MEKALEHGLQGFFISFFRMIFLIYIVQLVRHKGEGFAAFEDVRPVGGDEAGTEADAFQSAGDGGGGTALAGVVGRHDEGVQGIVFCQDAVHGDGQGFFCIFTASQGHNAVDVVPGA